MCTTEALAVQQACILALTSCSLLYANSSPLLCLLTDSLAAACGMGKGTCQNYTCSLSSSTNNITTDGECWKRSNSHSIAMCHMDLGYEVCAVGQRDHAHDDLYTLLLHPPCITVLILLILLFYLLIPYTT